MSRWRVPVVVFEATSLCSLDCLYCYNIWKRNGAGLEHFNSYKKAITTLKRINKVLDFDRIAFTGGEPLLAERFAELVLYCRLKNKGVTIISNGYTTDYDKYENLHRLGVSLFELPLHSAGGDIHDKMVNKPGAHEKTLRSVKFLQSIGADVVIDVVLTKMNIPVLGDTLRFLWGMGIKRIMFTRFNIGGAGIKNASLLTPSIDELRDAFSVADALVDELGLTVTSNVCTPLCVLNPSDYKRIGTQSCSANISNMPVTIDINGDVRICNHSPVIIGNIHNQQAAEIFESDYVKSWKTIKPDYCCACGIYDICYGGCRAASEQLGLGLGHPDPIISMEALSSSKKSGVI